MTDSRPSPGTGPSVCPFVALAEDRDRRADAPDESNRCYAERAPRRRDLSYQAEYCYSADFARCSVFLAWAARNAAEPAITGEAAGDPWASSVGSGQETEADTLPVPSPEGGLFGPPEAAAPEGSHAGEQLDWISATAWAEAPWDERAELEAEELDVFENEVDEADEADELDEEADEQEPAEEATTAPKVPAALPMRRRKPPQEPIRSRGSGEWFYADPPSREPLVSRRYGVTPQVLLVVLAVLVVSIVAFLIAAQLGGGQGTEVAAASPSPAPTVPVRPVVLPATTAAPSEEAEPTATPRPRYYRARAGDSLTSIAARFGVRPGHLQCLNGILDRNLIVLGARYQIPPEGYSCAPGWRRATPEP